MTQERKVFMVDIEGLSSDEATTLLQKCKDNIERKIKDQHKVISKDGNHGI